MGQEKVVIVGAGSVFSAWANPIQAEGLEIAAIVDVNLEAARKRKEEMGWDCKISTDLDTILKSTRPDFVIDLTVPDAHCEITCKALHAGAHVLGEKPMATRMEDALLMVKTSEETGRLYMVSQSRRWDPRHVECQKIVRNQILGELTSIICNFCKAEHLTGFRLSMESPLLFDMAIHHFDLARMFIERDPVSVYCQEYNPLGSWFQGAPAASCIFEFEQGIYFTYTGSRCGEGFQTGWNGDWYFTFTKGGLEYRQESVLRICSPIPKESAWVYPRDVKDLTPRELSKTAMGGALHEMLQFIRTGQIPQTECHDNIKSFAMVWAARQSSLLGQKVAVTWGPSRSKIR